MNRDPRLLAVLAIILALVVVGPASPALSPQPFVELHRARAIADTNVFVEPDGRATIAWTGQNNDPTVLLIQRPSGGPFGAVQEISAMANGEDPVLARAPDGTVVMVYRAATNEYTVRAPGGGPFGPAAALGHPGRFFDLDADGSGNATLVWKGERAGGLDFVAVSTTPIGTPFPAPAALTPDIDDNFIQPHVAVSPAGDAIVAWVREISATEEAVEVAVRSGGAFAPTQELDRGPLQTFSRPEVAIAPSGEALAVWSRTTGASSTLRLSARAPGASALSPPEDIAALGFFPQLVIDDQKAVIAWTQRNVLNPIEPGDPPNPAASAVVHAAIRPAGGSVGASVPISEASSIGDLRLRGVAVDASGGIVVGWERYLDLTYAGRFELARRPPGGPFDPPVLVAPIDTNTQAVRFNVLPSGDVLTAWSQILAPDDWVLRSSLLPLLPDAVSTSTDVCAPAPAMPTGGSTRSSITALTTAQLATNQRIGQAAVRRLNAIRDWLDDGIEARDLCGGTIGPADLASGIASSPRAASLAPLTAADPRPLRIAAATKRRGVFRRSALQLLFNQRIYQAAVRRANALERRLNGALTGGDLKDGVLTQGKLQDRLRITGIPQGAPVAASRTIVARPTKRGSVKDVDFSLRQVKINQRVAAAAVRRANALRARIQQGLTGAQFADGTIGGADLAPDALP